MLFVQPWLAPPPPPHHVAAALMQHVSHNAPSSGNFPSYCEGSVPNYPQHQAHQPAHHQHGPSSSGLVTVPQPVYSTLPQGIPAAAAARSSGEPQATVEVTRADGLGVGSAEDHQQGGGSLVGPLIVPGASSVYMQHLDASGHAVVRDPSVSDGGVAPGAAYSGAGVGAGGPGASGALHRSKPKGGEGEARRPSGRVPRDGSNTPDQA